MPGQRMGMAEADGREERQGLSSVDPWGLDVTLRIGYCAPVALALGCPLSTRPGPQSPGHQEPLPSKPGVWPSPLACSHGPKSTCVSERAAAKALSTNSGSSRGHRRAETTECVWRRMSGSSKKVRASSGVHMAERGHPRNSIGRVSTTGASAGPPVHLPCAVVFQATQPTAKRPPLANHLCSAGPIPRSSRPVSSNPPSCRARAYRYKHSSRLSRTVYRVKVYGTISP